MSVQSYDFSADAMIIIKNSIIDNKIHYYRVDPSTIWRCMIRLVNISQEHEGVKMYQHSFPTPIAKYGHTRRLWPLGQLASYSFHDIIYMPRMEGECYKISDSLKITNNTQSSLMVGVFMIWSTATHNLTNHVSIILFTHRQKPIIKF